MNALLRRSLVIALVGIAVITAAPSDAEDETVRLLNMFAKSDEDLFEVHIVANGDISGFKTTRRMGPDSYRLTIDVPALSPVDTKYDVATPFTRSFEMWPMKLGNAVYSRIVMEFDLDASSVVSQQRATRILVKVSRNSPKAYAKAGNGGSPQASGQAGQAGQAGQPGQAVAASDTTNEATGQAGVAGQVGQAVQVGEVPAKAGGAATPPELAAVPETAGEPTLADSAGPAEETEAQGQYISLFPAPNEDRPMFEPPIEQIDGVGDGMSSGFLLGRFLFRPMAEFSWIHGDNLTLQTDEQFADNAIYARAVAAFELIESEKTLDFAYQLRYRKFDKFQLLEENFSHGFDVRTAGDFSPRMRFDARNHFLRGSFETTEFDPGQEVFFNVEPFNHNITELGITMDLNERLGVSLNGGYGFVRFQEAQTVFFDYDTVTLGGTFFYRRSPVSSIFGEFVRAITPEPIGRPEAKSTANAAQVGIQGEITPRITGTVQAGYSWQEFGEGASQLDYRGLVASASVTRYFTEAASMTIEAGRQTSLSNFEDNNYYLNHFVTVQYTGPVRRNLQLVTGVNLFDNRYPRDSIEIPEPRNDSSLGAWIGAAYFFSPVTYFRADYRYERRQSNLERFEYSNNVIRVVFGVGFFSR